MDLDITQLQKKEIFKKEEESSLEKFANTFVTNYLNLPEKNKTFIKKNIIKKEFKQKIFLSFIHQSKGKFNSKEEAIVYGKLVTKLISKISRIPIDNDILKQKTPTETQKTIDRKLSEEEQKEICTKIKNHFKEFLNLTTYNQNIPIKLNTTDSKFSIEISNKSLTFSNHESINDLIYIIDFKKQSIKKNTKELKVSELDKFQNNYKKLGNYLINEEIKINM